jgi:hypothetical protein
MVAPLSAPSRRAHVLPLALRAALALLLVVGAGPAWAQAVKTAPISISKTVVAPRGMPVATRFDAELRCTSPSGPTQVRLSLVAGRPAAARAPVGSECVVDERPVPVPAGTAACSSPAWAPIQYSPSARFTVPQSGAITRIVITNTLTCARPGRLILVKRTNPAPGIRPLVPRFLVRCGPAGPNSRVAIPASGQAVVSGIPAGSLCTLTEEIPRSTVPNCAWTPSQNPPGDVPIPSGANVTVTVTNDWICRSSNLVIAKTTVAAGVTLPAQIPFSVSCRPGGSTTVMVPSNGSSAPLAVAAPSACTIAEQTPSAPAGCSWTMTQNPAGIVRVAAGATVTVAVANKLSCQAQPGSLIITKSTVAPGVALPAQIPFSVNCGPGRAVDTVMVPSNGSSAPLAIPAPAACTVSEQTPPAPAGCAWTATQNPSGSVDIAAGATVTVTVANKLSCQAPPGGLIIRRTFETNLASINLLFMPSQTVFDVKCTPAGPTTTISVPLNGDSSALAVPGSSTCLLTERVSHVPPECTWRVTQVPSGNVTIPAGPATVVKVDVIMFCVPPGEIRIEKSTTVPPGMAIPESFQFEISCTNFRSPEWTVPANGESGRILIPPANICSVAERIPPAPAGCRWTTTQSPAGDLTIRPGEVSRVVFANRLECG